MRSRFPADYTDEPLISLTVQLQLFSMLFTLPVHFDGLRLCRTRAQTLQIVQFLHQVLHQVVFSEAPLGEHLREQRKKKDTETDAEMWPGTEPRVCNTLLTSVMNYSAK